MDIKQEIEKVKEEIRVIEKVEYHRSALEKRYSKMRQRMKEIKALLKENERNFTGLGQYEIVRKILGTKTEKEESKQAYLKLILEERELEKTLRLTAYELDVLYEKMSRRTEKEDKLKILIKSREGLIEKEEQDLKKEVEQINNNITRKNYFLKEIQEAIKLGYSIKIGLENLLERLPKANFWTRVKSSTGFTDRSLLDKIEDGKIDLDAKIFEFEDELTQINEFEKTIDFPTIIMPIVNQNSQDSKKSTWIQGNLIRALKQNLEIKLNNTESALAYLKAERKALQEDLMLLNQKRLKTLSKS